MNNLEKKTTETPVELKELTLEEQININGGSRNDPKQEDLWDIISKWLFQ
ncbi:molybdenum ABC transporter substrate-binding protein [Sphingobacterium spiritivorum]|nr:MULTISPECIES: molybdenum ABC transporter substrate-binding protein [Sphingobacterium]QQT27693.1 molybdenum ABC transporter substrate-binding protein [Sphingobacterium spiritivorum]